MKNSKSAIHQDVFFFRIENVQILTSLLAPNTVLVKFVIIGTTAGWHLKIRTRLRLI